jgi:hypothetical protein
MRSQPAQINEAVDPTKQVTVADMPFKAEAVEQREAEPGERCARQTRFGKDVVARLDALRGRGES